MSRYSTAALFHDTPISPAAFCAVGIDSHRLLVSRVCRPSRRLHCLDWQLSAVWFVVLSFFFTLPSWVGGGVFGLFGGYKKITVGGGETNMATAAAAAPPSQVLLRDGKRWGLHSRMESLAFLGSTFRTVLQAPATATDVELGKKVIDRYRAVRCGARLD